MNLIVDIFAGASNGLREVWSNKVRTLLSMSGIVLGVAALVAMVGIVQGMLGNMRASFEPVSYTHLTLPTTPYV